MKAAVALLLLTISWQSAAHADTDNRETVLWHVSDFPPYFILSGPQRSTGIADRRLEILIERLPAFRHQIVEAASAARILEEIKTKPNVCNVAFVKTSEREAVMEFSATPIVWTLPNGVITTRLQFPQFKPYLTKRGELRLDDLLGDSTRYRIGIIAGRSFGVGIDEILKKHNRPGSVVIVPSSDAFESRLLKLLNQSEFEAIVGYAVELSYVTRRLGLDERDFVFLPVAEEPPLLPGYVACSKSDFGRRAMAAINRAIRHEGTLREVELAYRAWLDQESQALYDRLQSARRRTQR